MAQEPVKIRRVDFYPADWLEGTIGLRDDERGVYIQAIMLIYARGGPITKELLQASCSCHGNALNRIVRHLEKLGKLVRKGPEIDQKRCGKELERARKRADNLTNSRPSEPTRPAARETPSSSSSSPSLDSPKSLPSRDLKIDKIDEGEKPPRSNRRARGTNPRARGTNPRAIGTNPRAQTKFNHNGVTEHRPAHADLRDPVELAIELGLRDANGKFIRR